jgi:cation diffusion facilitator family transporter
MTSSSSRKVIYAALLGNVLVALTKFVSAGVTGSSAMLSEGVHSLVDTGNEVLLLYGLRRAARPPDEAHPLGHGRELYFWSFIVALLIFAVGAGVSLYEGITHVLHAVPLTNPLVNYVVLAFAIIFESGSWWVAFREFRAAKGGQGYYEAVRQSKDPPGFLVLFEDSAALIGLLIALVGTAAADLLELPVLDGVASIAIGLVLAVVALFLAQESKALLIGEGAAPEIVASICRIARSERGVEHANGLFTVHLGPRQVVAALSVDFADGRSARDVEEIVARIERRIRERHPEVISIFIKPQSIADFRRSLERRAVASAANDEPSDATR